MNEPRRWRPNGTGVLFILVALGLAFGAGLYRIFQPRAVARTERMLAEAPTTLEGRLSSWVEVAAPIVHQRLTDARISSQQPWIVTHTIGLEGEPGDVWGIASDELTIELLRTDGRRAVVRLPEPRWLARTTLVGDYARHVPRFEPDAAPPDANELLKTIARYALRIQIEKLPKDIEGAELVVEVEPRST